MSNERNDRPAPSAPQSTPERCPTCEREADDPQSSCSNSFHIMADFCVCDYRPRRKCSVHPPQSTQTMPVEKIAMQKADEEIARLNEKVAQEVAKVGQSPQTAEEFCGGISQAESGAVILLGGPIMCEFMESYASSRVASLQAQLEHERDYILERMCEARDKCLERAETAEFQLNHMRNINIDIHAEKTLEMHELESKLSTLTGIARELAAAAKDTVEQCECEICERLRGALGKFAEWERKAKS